MARPLFEISVEALFQSSYGKVFVRDLDPLRQDLNRSLCSVSVQDLCTGLLASSLYKLPIRGLSARFVSKLSAQARYESSLGKIAVRPVRDFVARSLYKLPKRGLLTTFEDVFVQTL